MTTENITPVAMKKSPMWVSLISANAVMLAVLAVVLLMFWTGASLAAPVDQPAGNNGATPNEAGQETGDRHPVPQPPPSATTSAPSSEKSKDQAAPPARPKPQSVAEVIERVNHGVVLIVSHDSKGNELGLGSGFVIDASGLVATNFHVLRTASAADATFMDGTKIEITGCRAWDEDSDLAILQLAKQPKNDAGRSAVPRHRTEAGGRRDRHRTSGRIQVHHDDRDHQRNTHDGGASAAISQLLQLCSVRQRVDSDECGNFRRQQRRSAVELGRRSDRHQHLDCPGAESWLCRGRSPLDRVEGEDAGEVR